MFRAVRGKSTKLTANCLKCRESSNKNKKKDPELTKLNNKCNREGLNFSEERVKAGLKKVAYVSEKRIENKMINGIEHAWCSTHKEYKPASKFAKSKSKFNGLHTSCKDCNKDYRDSREVKEKLDELTECKICGEKWKFKSMYDHMRNKHSDNVYKWNCNVCQVDCKHEKLYNKHLNTFMHQLNKQNSTLNVQKVNEFVDQFLENMKSQNNNFNCTKICKDMSVCTKKFTSIDSLELHIGKCHDGEYKYFCSYPKCDKQFIYHANYDKHVKQIHKGQKNMSCPVCHVNMPISNKKNHITSCIIKLVTGRYKGNSQHERHASMFLDLNHVQYEFQKKFADLVDKSHLSYDYYLPEYNILLEVNGGYHYVVSGYSNGENILQRNIDHDAIKKEYAEKHNYQYVAYDATKNMSFGSVAKLLSGVLKLTSPITSIEKLDDYISVYLNGGKIPDFHEKLITLPPKVCDIITQYMQ